MNGIVIIAYDPDRVMDSAGADTLEEGLNWQFGMMSESDVSVQKIFEPDEIPGNDAELGALVREFLNK